MPILIRQYIIKMSEQNPREFYCPLTNHLMKDPVLTEDGFCFERSAIQQWFSKGNKNNPITFMDLSTTKLISNNPLRSIIARFQGYVDEIGRLGRRCEELEQEVERLRSARAQESGYMDEGKKDSIANISVAADIDISREPYEYRYGLGTKDLKRGQNFLILTQKYYDTAAGVISSLPDPETIEQATITVEVPHY